MWLNRLALCLVLSAATCPQAFADIAIRLTPKQAQVRGLDELLPRKVASCDDLGDGRSCSAFCEEMNQGEPTYAGPRCIDDGLGHYSCVCCFTTDGVDGNPPCPEPSLDPNPVTPINPSVGKGGEI